MPGQYKYSYQGKAVPQGGGVLDKNYYSDLGFSTSKGNATETRKNVAAFDEEVATQTGLLDTRQGELDVLTEESTSAAGTAWDDSINTVIQLGSTTWEVPKYIADNITEAIKDNYTASESYYELGTDYSNITKDVFEAEALSVLFSPTGLTDKRTASTFSEEAVEDLSSYRAQTALSEADADVEYYVDYIGNDNATSIGLDTREGYNILVNALNKNVVSSKEDYISQYLTQFDSQMSGLNLEVSDARNKITEAEANIDMQKTQIQESQATQREGMKEVYSKLFRQRG